MWRLIFCFLCGTGTVSALIFPLSPGQNGEYDSTRNVLRSYEAVWRTNGHAIVNVAAQGGVVIAPKWILTAWHVARQMDESWFVNDDLDRYYYREKVDLGNDLALVRVDRPFPFYSKVQKFPGGSDDILTVYGQSAAPREPILDLNQRPVGWRFAPLTNHPALRWGKGRRLPRPHSSIEWDFTNGDPLLGLDCAGVGTNDSGGGIFSGDAVVGVITHVLTQGFRRSLEEPFALGCEDRREGHVFDASTLHKCTVAAPPITRAYGAAVYPALSNIFARISPPVRINVGGMAVAEGGKAWESSLDCAGCSWRNDTSEAPIMTSHLADSAPQSVYRTAAYIEGDPGAAMTFTVGELIKYETYKVRLHFSSVFPADEPGGSRVLVVVNGHSQAFDPFTGVRRAAILSFENVAPDEESRIVIKIKPPS